MSQQMDRRLGKERRGLDVGPPGGWRERRRRVERRLIRVAEIDFRDWVAGMVRWRTGAAAVQVGQPAAPVVAVRPTAAHLGDRRQGRERRVEASGPPTGMAERRLNADRRQLGVAEVSMDEWLSAIALK